MNFNKEAITQLLRDGTVSVVFTKTNGESRELQCTLCKDIMRQLWYVPSANATGKPRVENPDLICAYDLVNEDWRSFKVSSVTKVTKL